MYICRAKFASFSHFYSCFQTICHLGVKFIVYFSFQNMWISCFLLNCVTKRIKTFVSRTVPLVVAAITFHIFYFFLNFSSYFFGWDISCFDNYSLSGRYAATFLLSLATRQVVFFVCLFFTAESCGLASQWKKIPELCPKIKFEKEASWMFSWTKDVASEI